MKIYDISQEVFSSRVYPGDPSPSARRLSDMSAGALYNLTEFTMCAHNGTHVDAPSHFIDGAKTVDALDLSRLVGKAYVAHFNGILTAIDANALLDKAENSSPEASKRLLIKGDATVTEEAAKAMIERGIFLIGVESQSVGPIDAPMATHKLLLGANVVLLEGIQLTNVPEGEYLLCAAPINLGGLDGAPCRALLIEL